VSLCGQLAKDDVLANWPTLTLRVSVSIKWYATAIERGYFGGAAPKPPGFIALISPRGIIREVINQSAAAMLLPPRSALFRNLAGAQVASQHCPILLPGKSRIGVSI